MSSGRRFKFNGSKIQVSVGAGAALPITAISQADPAVVSATAHGFTLGAALRIAAVVGMTEVNDKLFVVDNPEVDDFELAGVDSSGYNAYASGGTATPLTYSAFCELTGIDQQDGTSDEIDVTTVCSTAKEFEVGLSDSGTLTLNYNYSPTSDVQAAFRAAKKLSEEVVVRVVMPNSGGTIVMVGKVQQSSFSGSNGTVYTGNTQLKLTGEIFVLEAE